MKLKTEFLFFPCSDSFCLIASKLSSDEVATLINQELFYQCTHTDSINKAIFSRKQLSSLSVVITIHKTSDEYQCKEVNDNNKKKKNSISLVVYFHVLLSNIKI